jgi:hypothetical protein
MTKTAQHEIGGISVVMTQAQADRWNSGDTTVADLNSVSVAIPEPGNQARYITLRRATNSRLEPEISRMMDGSSANRIGEWT